MNQKTAKLIGRYSRKTNRPKRLCMAAWNAIPRPMRNVKRQLIQQFLAQKPKFVNQ